MDLQYEIIDKHKGIELRKLFINLRLKRYLKNAKEREPGVFEIPGGHLSFVLGLVHPNIYLDCGL